jgi:acyl carrier protein
VLTHTGQMLYNLVAHSELLFNLFFKYAPLSARLIHRFSERCRANEQRFCPKYKGFGMKNKIRSILASEGKLAVTVDTLGDDDDLYAAGLTSFASVQLMLELEDSFDVEFSEQMLNRRTFQSISSIAAALSELQT